MFIRWHACYGTNAKIIVLETLNLLIVRAAPILSGALRKMTTLVTIETIRRQEAEMLRDIQELVEIESPSSDKRAVDRLAELLARKFQAMGARTQFHKAERFGTHLQADFAGGRDLRVRVNDRCGMNHAGRFTS